VAKRADVLELFHPAVAEWFRDSFAAPTPPQSQGWPAIARGESTLILAPTGSGKTLTAFLWAINQVMFGGTADPPATAAPRTTARPRRREAGPRRDVRVLYVSPLKALAVDVERNLRAPLAGIAHRRLGRHAVHPARDRGADRRHAAAGTRPVPA
jgi:ATP-dependent Lhr-like helicase